MKAGFFGDEYQELLQKLKAAASNSIRLPIPIDDAAWVLLESYVVTFDDLQLEVMINFVVCNIEWRPRQYRELYELFLPLIVFGHDKIYYLRVIDVIKYFRSKCCIEYPFDYLVDMVLIKRDSNLLKEILEKYGKPLEPVIHFDDVLILILKLLREMGRMDLYMKLAFFT